ncbi:hypothetical protein SAMN05444277_10381 [Parafilimonas terrae]|uniref:Uncharacterized protein n=1 Tax=Parafilimonas terrae TaxID=1465490 RepID=A0A1I5U5N0_9BACT|nr:hypothetical protein SAMN05444277_10381 [Parafilimonas terrae]
MGNIDFSASHVKNIKNLITRRIYIKKIEFIFNPYLYCQKLLKLYTYTKPKMLTL